MCGEEREVKGLRTGEGGAEGGTQREKEVGLITVTSVFCAKED